MGDSAAAAIRYDDSLPAPFVLASGRGHAAQRLLDVARRHGVPVTEVPELAERLIMLDPGTMIPESLFVPVAEVLSFVLAMDENVRQTKTNEKTIGE
ncbi:MAG: EscU/YscU/HrcU family type III secretion system export apparatus switch protein [Alkalispirochaeta sp.]